jgi:hypothetical protein
LRGAIGSSGSLRGKPAIAIQCTYHLAGSPCRRELTTLEWMYFLRQ